MQYIAKTQQLTPKQSTWKQNHRWEETFVFWILGLNRPRKAPLLCEFSELKCQNVPCHNAFFIPALLESAVCTVRKIQILCYRFDLDLTDIQQAL